VAYTNIRFRKPNMTIVNGYFYMFDESQDMLIEKVDDGDTSFTYPLTTPITNVINQTHYDGRNFWTLENYTPGGFTIRRWRIDNRSIVELKDTFIYASDASNTYDSDAFGVEHYITEFSCTVSGGNNTLCLDEYYDTVVEPDLVLSLGPNADDDMEDVTVSGIVGTDVILTSGTQYTYEDGDQISFYKSLFVFNNYTGLDSSKGTLFRFDAYDGSHVVSDVDLEYRDVTAAVFARVQNAITASPDAHTLLYVKDRNAKLRNMSDLLAVVEASTVNDSFTGDDFDPPNTTRWSQTAGNPYILNNSLFMNKLGAATQTTLESNYNIVGDFDLQISGAISDGFFADSSDIAFFEHYINMEFPSNSYEFGIFHGDTGIVVEYTMDSVSGTTLFDTSGNSNDAFMSSIAIVPGIIGNAAEINSDTDYIQPSTPIAGSVVSVSMWYYYGAIGGGGWNTLICRNGGTYHHILINDGSRQIGFYDGGWNSSGYALTLGQWYHIVLIKNGSNSKLYINNVLRQNSNSSFNNNSWPIGVIGNYSSAPGNQGARGKIDQVRIYNRAITTNEIFNLYSGGTGTSGGLFLYNEVDGVKDIVSEFSGSEYNYLFRATRTDNNLNFYYKTVTSGVPEAAWNSFGNVSVPISDCKLQLALSTDNMTVSGTVFDDLIYNSGKIRYPQASIPYYGVAIMDNIRANQIDIIDVYDVAVANRTLYRLQDEGTYYGTNNDWGSQYNYQVTPLRSFIDSIIVTAYPVILPANGVNITEVNASVFDQYGNGVVYKPVFWTDTDDDGYVTINPSYTDIFFGTGKSVTYYRAGITPQPVTVEGTATQDD